MAAFFAFMNSAPTVLMSSSETFFQILGRHAELAEVELREIEPWSLSLAAVVFRLSSRLASLAAAPRDIGVLPAFPRSTSAGVRPEETRPPRDLGGDVGCFPRRVGQGDLDGPFVLGQQALDVQTDLPALLLHHVPDRPVVLYRQLLRGRDHASAERLALSLGHRELPTMLLN
jgi:hypothetical protein